MGNCIGQRSLRDPKKEKENAPKTPKKDTDVKGVAEAPGADMNKAMAVNGNSVEKPEESKEVKGKADSEVKGTVNDAATQEEEDDKKGEAGENTTGVESLSTSWAVFDDDEDDKMHKNIQHGEDEDKPLFKIVIKEKVDSPPSNQSEIGVQEQIKEERSIQRVSNSEKQVKVSEKSDDDDSRRVKVVENKVVENVEEMGNQDRQGGSEEEVKDAVKMEAQAVVDRPKDEGQVIDTKNADAEFVGTGNSETSDMDTGRQESINVLNDLKRVRLEVKETKNELIANRTQEENESEEEKNEEEKGEEDKSKKRLGELKLKMKYASTKEHYDKIIDFETLNFMDEILNGKVILEDIFICGREVSGLIAISSEEQHPKVTVRYTTDSWETNLEEESILICEDGDKGEAFQRSFFSISVPFTKSMEFAVHCLGSHGEMWDNNNGVNYRIEDIKEENEGYGGLVPRFTPLKKAMFSDLVSRKSVVLKSYSISDGKVKLSIATKESCIDYPVVRYTLDDWKSSKDLTSVERKRKEEGENMSEVQLDVAKEAKMNFAIFWKHDGVEYWDNNDGKNFEIQC